jgi:DNA-binding response OmpR family regulator
VLVVDDDAALAEMLSIVLRNEGFEPIWCAYGDKALDAFREGRPDLVLLDVMLPGFDGHEVCRRIQVTRPVPVLMLTARDEESDLLVGLGVGADDYLTKPFRLTELLARLRAHLRRRTPAAGSAQLSIGHVVLDLAARRCFVDGAEVALRPKELDLLSMLMSEAGSAVSRDRLMAEVWDEHWSGSTKTLDMHVSSLRRKLHDAGEDPDRIATVRGFGYRYERVLSPLPL